MKRFLVTALSMLSLNAFADVDNSLADHIGSKFQQADAMAGLVCTSSAPSPDGQSAADEVRFTQFFVGFIPTATFGINSVLSFQVSPEITFVFEKVEIQD